MTKVDIKSIVKNLSKNELRDLISLAQKVLSSLFSSDEIKDMLINGLQKKHILLEIRLEIDLLNLLKPMCFT